MQNFALASMRTLSGLTAGIRLLAVAFAACTSVANPACAQVAENVLLDFGGAGGGVNTGNNPIAPLRADTSGPAGTLRALYGTTSVTAFSLTPPKNGKNTWKFTTLWTFPEAGSSKPWFPSADGLFAFGNRITLTTPLYGTTFYGGNPACNFGGGYIGCGVVYSLVGKTLNAVYDFTGGGDGGAPGFSGVIADKEGSLYTGTQYAGGASNCGTVIKLTPPPRKEKPNGQRPHCGPSQALVMGAVLIC
jgi:hypothetical protein